MSALGTFGAFQLGGRAGIASVTKLGQWRIVMRLRDDLKEEAANEGHEESEEREEEE